MKYAMDAPHPNNVTSSLCYRVRCVRRAAHKNLSVTWVIHWLIDMFQDQTQLVREEEKLTDTCCLVSQLQINT